MIGNRQQLEPQQKKKTNTTTCTEAETESIAETSSAKTVGTIASKRTTAKTNSNKQDN